MLKQQMFNVKGKNNETSLRHFNVSTQTNEINEYWFV